MLKEIGNMIIGLGILGWEQTNIWVVFTLVKQHIL